VVVTSRTKVRDVVLGKMAAYERPKCKHWVDDERGMKVEDRDRRASPPPQGCRPLSQGTPYRLEPLVASGEETGQLIITIVKGTKWI
jgi:hypothetical protein